MGFFDKLFGRAPKEPKNEGYFKMLNGYSPVFMSWDGRLYENELVRASVDAIARHASKLQIVVKGMANQPLQTQLRKAPNSFQTWSQFLYRTATVLNLNNTAFIVPVFGDYGQIVGIYPIAPVKWELVQSNGEPWIRFTFDRAEATAFRLEEVGILTRFQYRSDMFGEQNSALKDTMNLISIQRQAITESAKNSASYRFMAQVNNFTKADDLAKERKRFTEENLSSGVEGGGMLLFPNTYTNIKELSQRSYSVDKDQLDMIQTNVFNYFGVNQDVLQNKAYGDAWSSFYEGCLEPFSIQLSETLTRMLFTEREQGTGNFVQFTSNRLQFMTDANKLAVSKDLLDRGVITINQALEIWNLPGIGEKGDIRIIRGEYYNADEKTKVVSIEEDESNEE